MSVVACAAIVNLLLTYHTDGTTFFANAGVQDPFLVSVVVNVVQMAMTLPGIWGVERFGRRPLLLWGAVTMSICAYLIAILDIATSVHDLAPQRAVIALVCIFFAAYASTWGPLGWVIPSEIVPLNVRAKVVSLSGAVHGYVVSAPHALPLLSHFWHLRSQAVHLGGLFRVPVPCELGPRGRGPRREDLLHLGLDDRYMRPLRAILRAGDKGARARAD